MCRSAQNPNGQYAAVIPKWWPRWPALKTHYFRRRTTSRDFCYIRNVLQMNTLAAVSKRPEVLGKVFNVALNARTMINDLYQAIDPAFAACTACNILRRAYATPPREIQHSQADMPRHELLGYAPEYDVISGLDECLEWYIAQHLKGAAHTEKQGPDLGAISVDL